MRELATYLIFSGNCREAMSFYGKCFGAPVHFVTFGEMPGGPPEGAKDRIMHARLTQGALALMASDNMPGMPFHQGDNFSISVGCETVQEAEQLFKAFSEKGKVTMPIQETFWAIRFGMLTDQFGINWMFNLEKAKVQAGAGQ